VEVTRPEAGVEDATCMGEKAPERVAEEALRKARARRVAENEARREEKIAETKRTADQVRRGAPRRADDDKVQGKVKRGLDEWFQRFS
jgi:hypothetical protein